MSIYKRCSSKSGELSKIAERVEYVWDKNKTKESLCHVYGVSKEHVYQDMIFIKQIFRQLDGRQYLHWVLSHDTGVSVDIADVVALEVLKMIGEHFQVIVGTHTNTLNVHSHFLINSVDYETGKKFSESKQDMLTFRKKVNSILVCYGLKACGNVETISEEALDKEDNCTKTMESEESTEDTSVPFSLYRMENNHVFRGEGSIEDDNLYIPGILHEVEMPSVQLGRERVYEGESIRPPLVRGMVYGEKPTQTPLIRGMTYREKTVEEGQIDVRIRNSAGLFSGEAKREDGKFYLPGMLYEIEEEI